MTLIRLIYASRSQDASVETINNILEKSRGYNAEHGVTGVLCGCGSYFMQVLEGGRDAVNVLYKRILNDPRHSDPIILRYEEITERHFGYWTMGHVNLSKINTSMVLKYSPTTTLDPYRLPGSIALALLEELHQTASIGRD